MAATIVAFKRAEHLSGIVAAAGWRDARGGPYPTAGVAAHLSGSNELPTATLRTTPPAEPSRPCGTGLSGKAPFPLGTPSLHRGRPIAINHILWIELPRGILPMRRQTAARLLLRSHPACLSRRRPLSSPVVIRHGQDPGQRDGRDAAGQNASRTNSRLDTQLECAYQSRGNCM